MTEQGLPSPFSLGSEEAYQAWRTRKLAGLPQSIDELIVDINGLTDVSPAERRSILRNVRRASMAIYRCRDKTADARKIRKFGEYFGLEQLDYHLCAEEDGVAELTVAEDDPKNDPEDDPKSRFIPYTSRRLGWHTDGYYNDQDHRLRTVLLHCARPAASGGENALLDPEIAYIRLRDENPDLVSALMHPGCMTIPAHAMRDGTVRPERAGPVFGIFNDSGALFMRYTERRQNIIWRDDPVTEKALGFLRDLLASDDEAIFRIRLKAGEGIISNNVLHNRAAFEDDLTVKRLVYRARYLDPISPASETGD